MNDSQLSAPIGVVYGLEARLAAAESEAQGLRNQVVIQRNDYEARLKEIARDVELVAEKIRKYPEERLLLEAIVRRCRLTLELLS